MTCPLPPELSQDLNGNSQAAATRQKMAQLEQMLSALDQLRRVGVCALSCCEFSQKYTKKEQFSKNCKYVLLRAGCAPLRPPTKSGGEPQAQT